MYQGDSDIISTQLLDVALDMAVSPSGQSGQSHPAVAVTSSVAVSSSGAVGAVAPSCCSIIGVLHTPIMLQIPPKLDIAVFGTPITFDLLLYR